MSLLTLAEAQIFLLGSEAATWIAGKQPLEGGPEFDFSWENVSENLTIAAIAAILAFLAYYTAAAIDPRNNKRK